MSARNPTTAPPPLPPKDKGSTSNSNSNSHSSIFSDSNAASYINQDLAEAVRDSVQIKSRPSSRNVSPSTQQQNTHLQPGSQPPSKRTSLLGLGGLDDAPASTLAPAGSRAPRLPSLDPLVPRRTPSPNPPPAPSSGMATSSRTFQPTHGYSQSSPDMSSITQPALPSTRMQQIQNPFEQDEIEPPGTGRVRPPGAGHASKGSLGLGAEGPPTKTRARRSMSTDSYGFNDPPAVKELSAGQRKALEDKKGSRHADVIDTWDPTGLGTAMWHHSGPYDAAAPSRNVNAPTTKAPMQAFNGLPVQSPPRTGPTTISLSSPPVPPVKETVEILEKPVPKRAHTTTRVGAPVNNRRISGGLTGQYSTSMPTSGGYFPDPAAAIDEAALARKDRAREREQKRRALKAAWGIDEPEPFEDFGGSPNDGSIDIADDVYSPDSFNAALPSRPMRSPGLRLGLGPRTPSVQEETTSPISENAPPISRSGNYNAGGGAGPGGVKRTKSLMQKFKTMVRQRSDSVESEDSIPPYTHAPSFGAGQRSRSFSAGLGKARPTFPSSGWADEVTEEPLEEEVEDREGVTQRPPVPRAVAPSRTAPASRRVRENPRASSPRGYSPSNELPPSTTVSSPSSEIPSDNSTPSITTAVGSGAARRPGILKGGSSGRVSPLKGSTNTHAVPTLPIIGIQHDAEGLEDDETVPDGTGSGFVLVESPSSKARVMRALKKEHEHVPANRAKGLPMPPVKPVIPTFDDLIAPPNRKMSRSPLDHQSQETSGGLTVNHGNEGLKRKTSMVKKLRERITK